MDADTIPLIPIRELILRTPQMYIGHQWDADGLYFLFFEVMRLAIRPESANDCSKLNVTVEGETTLSIADDGRGLPVESRRIGQSVELPKVEHVFLWLMPTNPLPAYYREFGFLNHLGCVLNAVSDRLQVKTIYEGHHYELICGRGEIINNLRTVSETVAPNSGTRLIFTPDPALFPNFKFDLERLFIGLRSLKNEYPSVNLALEDKRSNQNMNIPSSI